MSDPRHEESARPAPARPAPRNAAKPGTRCKQCGRPCARVFCSRKCADAWAHEHDANHIDAWALDFNTKMIAWYQRRWAARTVATTTEVVELLDADHSEKLRQYKARKKRRRGA